MAGVRVGQARRAALLASYFTFFLPAGVLLSFLSPFLATKGLTVQEIGALVGLLFAVKLIASPVIAYASDQLGAHHVTRAVFLVASVAASVGLQLLGGFAELAAAIMVLSLSRNYFQSVLEALATEQRTAGIPTRYGAIRLVGSIAVALGVAWMGAFGHTPAAISRVFTIVLVSSSVGFFVSSLSAHRRDRDTTTATTATITTVRGPLLAPGASASHPYVALGGLLVTSACLIGAHGLLYSVGSLQLTTMGFERSFVTLCWIAAFTGEAVGFFLLDRVQRLPHAALLSLVAIGGAGRWWMFANADAAPLVVAAFALHAVTFAWCHGVLVLQIRRLFTERFAATGQAIYLAVAHGMGISSVAYFGAKLYAAHGRSAFYLPLILTLLGCGSWAAMARHFPPTKATP
jgi:hypothetical protein